MPNPIDDHAQIAPRILVAEDNDTDYLLLMRHVRKLWPDGEARRAGNRAELQAALAQAWDLIITDYHLLDIQEDELMALIAAEQPQTRCVLMSGSMYNMDDVVLPPNVFGKLEKGHYAELRALLAQAWPGVLPAHDGGS